jgi:CGNR zinc finger/Putative stress-induced transcription regulator
MAGQTKTTNRRSPGHEVDASSPAPADLETVRSFLSIHDHEDGRSESLPPTTESLAVWLRAGGGVGPREPLDERDLRWGLHVRTALRTKVYENMGHAPDPRAARVLDDAARRAGLRVSFADPGRPLLTESGGVRGAIGRLLATAVLAELDGSWARLRECADSECISIFYDRSKNGSTRWCSMASCGNRNKVRRFRERERSAART